MFPVVELSTLSYSGKTILTLPLQSVLQQIVLFGKYTNYVFSQCFIPLYFRGAEANTPCVFPFQYGEGGVTHYGCVTYGYPVFFPMFYLKSIICFMFSPFVPQVRCTMAIIGVSVVPTVCCMKIPSAGGKTRRSR